MNYVIVAPAPTKSAGIMALHMLNHNLNAYGQTSRILTPGYGRKPDDSEIVVYPDCWCGNMYRAKNVVRFLLMFAGYFGQDSDFDSTELMYYYCPDFIHNDRDPDNILSVPMIHEPHFPYKSPIERSGSCYLAVKYSEVFGNRVEGLPRDCVEIKRNTQDLQELFSRVKTLHTFDNSAVNIEAGLCGIEIVWHLNRHTVKPFDFGEYFDWNDVRGSYATQKQFYYRRQLPDFIKRTQERFAK